MVCVSRATRRRPKSCSFWIQLVVKARGELIGRQTVHAGVNAVVRARHGIGLIGQGNTGQKRERDGIHLGRRNLIAGEGLAGGRIEDGGKGLAGGGIDSAKVAFALRRRGQ